MNTAAGEKRIKKSKIVLTLLGIVLGAVCVWVVVSHTTNNEVRKCGS